MEKIKTGVVFGPEGVAPKWFIYGGVLHKVTRIIYKWKKRVGRETVFYFSVECGSSVFFLSFSPNSLSWFLLEEENIQHAT